MPKKQLITLFLISLVFWITSQALLALLPVYAVRIGADPASIGNYLSLAFLALTIGTMAAGWLADKFQTRKLLLIGAGLILLPALWLMGHVTAFWQLAVLTALVWFAFGVGFSIVNILAGLFAGEAERGKIFGIIATNPSLGALIGGFVSGPIVDRWGYPTLFLMASLFSIAIPLIGLLLEDKRVDAPRRDAPGLPQQPALGLGFYLFLLATLLAFGASFVAGLGRPLLMDQLGFDPTQISGVVALGGAVTLPLPLILGWLSDRVGRYGLVVLVFFISAVGLVVLAGAVTFWQFALAQILLNGPGLSLAVAPALVTDLVPQDILGVALTRYGAAPTVGAIVSFALTGYAIQTLGMTTTYMLATAITVVAIVLVIQLQRANVKRLAQAQ